MAAYSSSFFQFVSAQRYFHLLAFEVKTSYNISQFWKDCGFKTSKNYDSSYDKGDFIIEHSRIITSDLYYYGENAYSVHEDGNPPYNYDVFVIEIKKSNMLIFGFPFKSLAINIMMNLVANKNLISKGQFIRPDLGKLVKHKQVGNMQNGEFSAFFSALELMLTGETDITSITLDGDKPMESALYKQTFSGLIENNECKVESCSLKCDIASTHPEEIPKTRSSIHLHISGNYKLYVHGSGNNVFTLPYLFMMLKKYNCMQPTSVNPLKRLHEDK